VHATDFSATAPEQLTAAARESGLADRITTTVHDVRDPLPVPDAPWTPCSPTCCCTWPYRVDAFVEGELPRRLWRITQAKR
jgi:hypothetical protein